MFSLRRLSLSVVFCATLPVVFSVSCRQSPGTDPWGSVQRPRSASPPKASKGTDSPRGATVVVTTMHLVSPGGSAAAGRTPRSGRTRGPFTRGASNRVVPLGTTGSHRRGTCELVRVGVSGVCVSLACVCIRELACFSCVCVLA